MRSKYLFARMQRKIKQLEIKGIPFKEYYYSLQQAQTKIVSLGSVLEEVFTIQTGVGKSGYDLIKDDKKGAVKKVIAIQNPPSWITPIKVIVSLKDWTLILKRPPLQTLYAYLFNNQILFMGPPTEAGLEVKLFCYLKDSNTTISATVEPELGNHWDDALFYYAMYLLTDQQSYYDLFFAEYNNQVTVDFDKVSENAEIEGNW